MASTGLAARDAVAARVQQRYEAREAASYTIWPPSPRRSLSDSEDEARRATSAHDADRARRHHRHHRERHRAHDADDEHRRTPRSDRERHAHRSHRHRHHHRSRSRSKSMEHSPRRQEPAPPARAADPSDDEEVGPQPYTETPPLDDASAPGDAASTQRRSRRNYATDERRAYLKQQAEERARKEAEIIAQFRDMVDTLQNTGPQRR
ncbi:hypothetical protein CBS14141_002212 [Malassezia furfur]|nr:hypothetical protein CBS14141_002212 [Malassezia furfur]